MTQKEIIDQTKEKFRTVIDGLHIISPNGKCLQSAQEALALLEQAENQEVAEGMERMGFKKAESPMGEGCTVICTICLKRLQLSKEEMARTCEIVRAHQHECSAEMRNRLDAQQEEIEIAREEENKAQAERIEKLKRTLKHIKEIARRGSRSDIHRMAQKALAPVAEPDGEEKGD